jgi:hypothetical protein
MAAISDSNAKKLNNMNRAADNVSLGTLLQAWQTGSAVQQAVLGASGSRLMSGSELDINTGLATVSGWTVQVKRSGSAGTVGAYAVAGAVAGHIKVNSASSGSLTSTDVITFFAFA